MEQTDAIAGAILGCATGDALGLPYEGVSRRRAARLLGEPDRHRFLLGRGMISDDTEHTCLVALALCEAPRNPDAFSRHLARGLRWWLLGLPAGIGSAALRATLRLWLGFSPSRSGVFSAGNGPAMRSPVLGAAVDDLDSLRNLVRISTHITHTDPKAYQGALAAAVAAWCARRNQSDPASFLKQFRFVVGSESSDEFDELLSRLERSVTAGDATAAFADQLGCRRGVSGYIYRSAPVALHAWLSHPRDYRRAVSTVIRCGGDADTTAAITGAIVGAGVGRAGIPPEWRERVWEWPRSIAWMERLAEATSRAIQTGEPVRSPRTLPVVGLARNGLFLAIVMYHVFRRLLPPY